MGLITGPETIAGSASGISSDQRVVNMDDTIHLLEPSKAPLTVFMGRLGTGEEAFSPEFNWLEDILAPKVVSQDGTGAASGATTVILASGDGAKVALADLIKNPATGEIFLVTAKSTDTLTVTRAFGTTATAAIGASQKMLIIGNANKEFAGKRTQLSTTVTKLTNYAQIFRTPFGFSRVVLDSKLYGGSRKKYQIKKKGIEHEVEQERQFLWGEAYVDTSTTGQTWATAGVDSFIDTNRLDAGGALDYSTFLTFAQQVFRYGNAESRLLLAAPIVISAVDQMTSASLLTRVEGSLFGVRLNKVQTSHGEFLLVKHNLLSEVAELSERAYALDMDMLKERVFTNGATKLKLNIHANDVDGEEHEYLTQKGLQFSNEKASGCLFNVTSL